MQPDIVQSYPVKIAQQFMKITRKVFIFRANKKIKLKFVFCVLIKKIIIFILLKLNNVFVFIKCYYKI